MNDYERTMMHERERIQREYDALPKWAQGLLDAVSKARGYGWCSDDAGEEQVYLTVSSDDASAVLDALADTYEVAQALTAPMPGTYDLENMECAVNLVELMADDDCAFDQPCAFGNRVEGHAVYCHNTTWGGAPRKCRRTWYTGGETRDEDCPGYVANPHYSK